MDLFNQPLKHQPESMDLFSQPELAGTPLAEKLRPALPDDILGQSAAGHYLKRIRQGGHPSSLILWGPPGSGKTSYARALMAELSSGQNSTPNSTRTSKLNCQSRFGNATDLGAKDLREIGQKAQYDRKAYQIQTVLFVDEIHRLNKSQQDVLLPFLESGDLILIGATTENPSYELNRAVLSRCQLIVFERLTNETLKKLVSKAFAKLNLSAESVLTANAQSSLIDFADGDARKLLGFIENISSYWGSSKNTPENTPEALSELDIQKIVGALALGYDRDGDQHFDLLSALIKSVRGSDADAGLYYLARMLKGGEPPLIIARRLVVLASEDIGNADPRALSVAIAGAQAVELVGLPECSINLAQVITYMASAPKSNRSYLGLRKAEQLVEARGSLKVPLPLRSSKTQAMKGLGYGAGYIYPHDCPKGFSHQSYLPEELKGTEIYSPSERGFEKQISEFKKWIKS